MCAQLGRVNTEAQDAKYVAKLKIEIETMKPMVDVQASPYLYLLFFFSLISHAKIINITTRMDRLP